MTLIRHANLPNINLFSDDGRAERGWPAFGANVAPGVVKIKHHERSSQLMESSTISTSMASSFETHRFAMLLRMRSQTLMVRSRALRGVSNHEAPREATDDSKSNRKTL